MQKTCKRPYAHSTDISTSAMASLTVDAEALSLSEGRHLRAHAGDTPSTSFTILSRLSFRPNNELTLIRRSCAQPDWVGRPRSMDDAQCVCSSIQPLSSVVWRTYGTALCTEEVCVWLRSLCVLMCVRMGPAQCTCIWGALSCFFCASVCEIYVTHTNTHEHMNTFIPTIQSRIILVYIHITVGLCVLLWSAIFLNVYPRDEYAIRIMHSPHKRDTKDSQYQLGCASGMEITRE